jgi:hypothetical protein
MREAELQTLAGVDFPSDHMPLITTRREKEEERC